MDHPEQKIVLGEWKSIESLEAKVAFKKISDFSSSIRSIEKGIKIYTRKEIQSDNEWEELVKQTATDIMNLCRGKPEDTPYPNYEEDKEIWETCFTRSSYSFDNNYEVMEKVGDAVIKFMMLEIVVAKFPKATPQTLSETASHLLSKAILSQISAELGWAGCVRTGYVAFEDRMIYRYDRSASEDIFEAVFGTINTIGNRKQFGVGTIYSSNLMKILISRGFFDLKEHAELPPKTAVEQLFKGKGWGKVEVKVVEKGQKYEASLKFTTKARGAIRYHSDTINFTTSDMVKMIQSNYPREKIENPAMIDLASMEYFGQGTGYNKEDAVDAAYADGASMLRKKNILTNIDSAKGYNQFINISLYHPFKRAYLKAHALGYSNIYISKPKQNIGVGNDEYDCQLYGVRGSIVELLITCIIPVEEAIKLKGDEIRRLVYNAYAEKTSPTDVTSL